MNRAELLAMDDAALWGECMSDFRKGTGNGGQKLNKTSSAVRLFHAETGISVNCLESRSQSVNRHLALQKLRFRIAVSQRCTPAESFKPEPAPSISGKHYSQWIADLFDLIASVNWDLKAAAVRAGISRSRLTKLIQRDPSLWREYLHESAKAQNEPEQNTTSR